MQGAWAVHTLWRRRWNGRRRDRREVNDLTQRIRPRLIRRTVLLLAALALTALAAIPMSGAALAQSPPPDSDNLSLVNRDRQMVERKKDGEFIARPVFSRKIDVLHYALRHPDTGEWVTNTYRCGAARKSSPRAGSTPSSIPSWTHNRNCTRSRLS